MHNATCTLKGPVTARTPVVGRRLKKAGHPNRIGRSRIAAARSRPASTTRRKQLRGCLREDADADRNVTQRIPTETRAIDGSISAGFPW